MAEFLITTDLSPINGLQIEANFDEMEKELTELMTPYKSLVVTDVKAAKDARAYCNKVKKALDESRKQVKKLWLSPYETFEAKVKRLTGICDEASAAIDSQVKSIEDKEKNERKEKIILFFNKNVGVFADYCDINAIWDDKWLNKTADSKACRDVINTYISHVAEDITAIENLQCSQREVLLREYKKTHSLASVMDLYKTLQSTNEVTPVNKENATEAKEMASNGKSEKIHTFTLEFKCTVAQAKAINEFFSINNINYRRVK